MFEIYRAGFTAGVMEATTRGMEDIRLNHPARIVGGDTLVASVTAESVQKFIDAAVTEATFHFVKIGRLECGT